MREYLFILVIAAVVTYLLTPVVRLGAIKINAQHAARSRDVHKEPTPLLGGLAMYGGLVAGLLVASRLSYLQQAFPSSRIVTGLVLAGGVLVVIGIVDDRWGLGAISKLAAQIVAGGILIWSGASLPWIPGPGSETVSLEPDLSYTLTILIVVVTINAVNFIDGLDGLAAGIVGISALSYMVYSYELTISVGVASQSVPAVVAAVLAGMCIGFLPHNFNPARIFMGDTGSMLLGLLLAYLPIESTATLDPGVLVSYAQAHPVNRFPTVLPLLIPVAIYLIPYTDLLLAVVRRTVAGKSPFDADRLHLHHRLLNMGHSHRQSVLLMYLWTALFCGLVVGLSAIRIPLIWFAFATVFAIAALVLATAPKLRPWRSGGAGKRRKPATVSPTRAAAWTATNGSAAPAAAPLLSAPPPFPGRAAPRPAPNGSAQPPAGPFRQPQSQPQPVQPVPPRPLQPRQAQPRRPQPQPAQPQPQPQSPRPQPAQPVRPTQPQPTQPRPAQPGPPWGSGS